jgi:putative MATE family efflux protein
MHPNESRSAPPAERRRSLFALDPPTSRRVLSLAVPIVLGMVTQTAINLIDTAFVGRLPPEQSIAGQAALGVGLKLLWAIGGFLSALAVGTQAITARRFGEGDRDAAGRTLTNSAFIAFTAGTAFSIIGYFLIPVIFPLVHDDPLVIREGVPYTRWRFLGIVSMVGTMSFKSFFDGIGRTHVHMVAAIIMNVVNAVLAWGLILGGFGMPQMGVEGAGIAAFVSTWVGLVTVVAWTFADEYRTTYHPARLANLDPRVMRDVLWLSLPSGVATAVVMSGFLLFDKIMAAVDALDTTHAFPVATSATWIIVQVMMVTFMTCIAFGTAAATLVSQSLGERRPEQARRYTYEAVRIGVYLMSLFGLAVALVPDVFMSVFTDKVEVIDAGRTTMRIMGGMQGLIAAAMIFMYALFGAGNTRLVMFVEIALHFGVLLPLGYLFGVHLDLGMEGAFVGAFAYVTLLACVLGWKFAEGRWQHIEV